MLVVSSSNNNRNVTTLKGASTGSSQAERLNVVRPSSSRSDKHHSQTPGEGNSSDVS